MRLRLLLGTLVVGMGAACGGGGDGGGGGGGGGGGAPVEFELREMGGSGKTGSVHIEPGVGTSELTLELTPPEGTDNADIHVHRGACEDINADTEIVHDVGFVTAGLGQGSIFVSLDQLTTGEFVVDVHKPGEPVELLACGAIPEG